MAKADRPEPVEADDAGPADDRSYAVRLGALIQGLRLRGDVSQEAVAEAAGTTVATVRRWEAGASAPKASQLAGLRSALDAPPAALVDPPDPDDDLARLLAESLPESTPRRAKRGGSAD